jgi:hypothetical protein
MIDTLKIVERSPLLDERESMTTAEMPQEVWNETPTYVPFVTSPTKGCIAFAEHLRKWGMKSSGQ